MISHPYIYAFYQISEDKIDSLLVKEDTCEGKKMLHQIYQHVKRNVKITQDKESVKGK